MSEHWIKMRSALASDQRVINIATATGLDEFAVVGRLHAVWSWLDCHSKDGTNVTVSRGYIDRLTQHPGFADAMRAVEWLAGEDGNLTFPDYTNHNGSTAKRRATEAKRQRNHRARNEICHAPTVTDVTVASGVEKEKSTVVAKATTEGAEKETALPTTEIAIAVATLFKRRLTTEWSKKEIKAYRDGVKRGVLTTETVSLLVPYYASERAKDGEGMHRRDLLTFLNNLDGEIDRAKAFSENPKAHQRHGSHQQTAPSRNVGHNAGVSYADRPKRPAPAADPAAAQGNS